MHFMDIVESHCYVVDNWQIYLAHMHSKHNQSINQTVLYTVDEGLHGRKVLQSDGID